MNSFKTKAEIGFVLLLLGMLSGMQFYMGWRVVAVAGIFSVIWFVISMVLLTRPPGVPEFVSERPGSDEQYVIRKDVLPKLPLPDRFRLSLGVACGSCLLIWVTLGLLAS